MFWSPLIRNPEYQQNVIGLKIAVLILCAPTNNLLDLLPLVPKATEALSSIREGAIVRVED